MKTNPSPALFSLALLAAVTPLAADSLWTAKGSREQGVVSDMKAGRVGDILTIVVSENMSQSSSQNKSSGTKSSMDASVTQFLFPTTVSKFGTIGGQPPGVKFSGASDFKGGGDISNTQSVAASAAVLVTDVLPNGNLVVAGVRRVVFSGETQNVVLHGIVRPADIATDNTIVSSNVAEARIEFISEGSLTDAEKRGWLSRLYEKLRPL